MEIFNPPITEHEAPPISIYSTIHVRKYLIPLLLKHKAPLHIYIYMYFTIHVIKIFNHPVPGREAPYTSTYSAT
jgi:hypothetical protein